MLKILCFFGIHFWKKFDLSESYFGYSYMEYKFCKNCKNISKND